MRRWILILGLCLVAQFSRAQEFPFAGGENIYLSIMYKWGAINTEVGTTHLELDPVTYEGQEAYHMTTKVWTSPFFDRFYKIRENLQSWVRADDLRPLRFTRSTFEGGYTATNEYNYDWEAGVIRADVVFESKPLQHLEIPMKEGEYDLISLLYHIRCLDESAFQKGVVTKVRFAIDDSVFDVYIKASGKETIKVRKMGKMEAWHLSCSVVQGALFDGDEDLHIWFSADQNRIPVAAKVPLKMGAVQAWLSAYSGLKYPLTALVTDERKR